MSLLEIKSAKVTILYDYKEKIIQKLPILTSQCTKGPLACLHLCPTC